MVELLVVIGIITVLFGAVFAAGTTLMARARVRNTQALLAIVQDAVDQFEREQMRNPTLTRTKAYRARFGSFPPDELEVFSSKHAYPLPWPKDRALTYPAGSEIQPALPYKEMKFHIDGLSPAEVATEHRDLAAMVVAIEMFGDESKAILDRVRENNRVQGPIDPVTGDPAQFIDRPPVASTWDPERDLAIRYIVDEWGVPISYLAQRDWVDKSTDPVVSTNHPDWNEASTEIVRLNGGRPVIFSYGPDGKEQLIAEQMNGAVPAAASLVGDFEDGHKVDHPFNTDNVYANESLAKKLAQGIPP